MISGRKGLIKGQLKMDFGPLVLCSCCHYPHPSSTHACLSWEAFLSDRSCFCLQPTLFQVTVHLHLSGWGNAFLWNQMVTRVCLSLLSCGFSSRHSPRESRLQAFLSQDTLLRSLHLERQVWSWGDGSEVLAEDLTLVPITHTAAHNCL